MADPYRCTVTIDKIKFSVSSVVVQLSTDADRGGVPQVGKQHCTIRAWADFRDQHNLSFSIIKALFELANVVTIDKIKPVKIEFWKDDSHEDVLCSYSFDGWIRRFETSNPIGLASNDEDAQFQGIAPLLNHMLVIDLQPVTNPQKFREIRFGN